MFVRVGFAALLCFGFAPRLGADSGAAPPDFSVVARPTYRFTARITQSEVPPFKVGEVIEGKFSYDLLAEREEVNLQDRHEHGGYESPQNKILFRAGGAKFVGGGVRVVVTSAHEKEMFGIGAEYLVLPDGWSPRRTRPTRPTQHVYVFGIALVRERPKNAIRRVALPERVKLSDFSFCQVRVQFISGARFPGGEAKVGAWVEANLETLEETAP
jgi:hypothetical protein